MEHGGTACSWIYSRASSIERECLSRRARHKPAMASVVCAAEPRPRRSSGAHCLLSPPAALLGEGEDALQWGLRNDREVHALGGVLRGTVELIEECGARRARAFCERQEGRLTAFGTRPLIAGVTGEHHAVDHQRVLAGREQRREPHVGRCAVRTCSLEDIVLRHWPTPGGSSRVRAATASIARRS